MVRANNNTNTEINISGLGKTDNINIDMELIFSGANNDIDTEVDTSGLDEANNNTNIEVDVCGWGGMNNDTDIKVDVGGLDAANDITEKNTKICESNLFGLLLTLNRSWTSKKMLTRVLFLAKLSIFINYWWMDSLTLLNTLTISLCLPKKGIDRLGLCRLCETSMERRGFL